MSNRSRANEMALGQRGTTAPAFKRGDLVLIAGQADNVCRYCKKNGGGRAEVESLKTGKKHYPRLNRLAAAIAQPGQPGEPVPVQRRQPRNSLPTTDGQQVRCVIPQAVDSSVRSGQLLVERAATYDEGVHIRFEIDHSSKEDCSIVYCGEKGFLFTISRKCMQILEKAAKEPTVPLTVMASTPKAGRKRNVHIGNNTFLFVAQAEVGHYREDVLEDQQLCLVTLPYRTRRGPLIAKEFARLFVTGLWRASEGSYRSLLGAIHFMDDDCKELQLTKAEGSSHPLSIRKLVFSHAHILAYA